VLRGLWEHQPSSRYPEVAVPTLLIGADTGDVAWSALEARGGRRMRLRRAAARAGRLVQPGTPRRARPAARSGRRPPASERPCRSDVLSRALDRRNHDDHHPAHPRHHGLRRDRTHDEAPHRRIFERLGSDVDAVLLDTPFGFQENAPILAEKAIEYFRDAMGQTVEAAGLTRTDTDDTVAIERGIARVRSADWLFAGPGSPTYALAQWTGTAGPRRAHRQVASGGAVVFSSAAALTLGVATVPVYEIYKVGRDPHWLDGLDVLSEIGLHVAVIPHYDNAEGGNHDTRFCYLGERRLAMLEPSLPDGTCSCSGSTSTPAS
jgi:hypothetical protein